MASNYSTFGYYSEEYKGTLSESLYTKYALQASAEIDMRTFGNAEKAHDDMKSELCLCECELVDAYARFEESYNTLPKGISSMNNDGFSAATSYGSSKTDSREAAQNSEIRNICMKYLLRPQNLLYPGVDMC